MRKLVIAVVLLFGTVLIAQPAGATPIDTVLTREMGGCTFQYIYGNFGGPYVNARQTNQTEANQHDCRIGMLVLTYSIGGGQLREQVIVAGQGAWYDTNWHSNNYTNANYTVVGAKVTMQACDGDTNPDIWRTWTRTVAVGDGTSTGVWTYQNNDSGGCFD
jgi:hypothetical protein